MGVHSNHPEQLRNNGDLRAEPLDDHRRDAHEQARRPRRRDAPLVRKGSPPQEAPRAPQGEEDLSLREQGGRGLRGSEGHHRSGRLQGHCCQRQDLGEGPQDPR